MVTPMNEDESINTQELKNQVNRLISAGVHGLFPLGTNGEGYILSESEKLEILHTVVKETKGRVPVYAGTGMNGTKDTIELSKKAESLGVDILSVITPGFAKASDDELYAHYEAVAKSVSLPIVLYNIPARTGNALSPAVVARLSEIDNIIGVKDSSGNFDNMLLYIEKTRNNKEDFAVISGNDSLIYWNLLSGGVGGIAGCANVYPKTMVSIYEYFTEGKLKEARQAQDSIRSFRDCFKYGNPNTFVKKAVALLGYPVGNARKPFDIVSEKGLLEMKKVMEANHTAGME